MSSSDQCAFVSHVCVSDQHRDNFINIVLHPQRVHVCKRLKSFFVDTSPLQVFSRTAQNLYSLCECPRRDTNCIYHKEWHQQSGGEGEQSPNGITQPGVLICVIKFEWGVLYQRKDYCQLKRGRK